MAYYDDWIAPFMIDEDSILTEIEEAYNNRHLGWTTKEGELILYKDMSLWHILNCVKMIKRLGIRKAFLPYLCAELKRRGFTTKI
jgi:hypothetical protein